MKNPPKKHGTKPLSGVDVETARERQVQQSLEIINDLLTAEERTHVVDTIRDVLQSRRDQVSPSI